MRPATFPPHVRDDVRLLVLDAQSGSREDAEVERLADWLAPGDLLVLNDAATIPASFAAVAPSGGQHEIRLLGSLGEGRWEAVLFGAGNWRTRTEDRRAPERLAAGSRLDLTGASSDEDLDAGAALSLNATIVAVSPISDRLVEIEFDREGAALWEAIYKLGRPVQYAYLKEPLAIWSVQTVLGSRPWAVEMPSAARPLTWRVLLDLRRRGVELATLTHAAGLSATGDPTLDAALPRVERYDISSATVDAIAATKKRGGRVIAVGTTVVRALEGARLEGGGELGAGEGRTGLIIDAAFEPAIVDGLLTGMHSPSESHYRLLGAFIDREQLSQAFEHAIAAGYRTHEFGDLSLILSRPND